MNKAFKGVILGALIGFSLATTFMLFYGKILPRNTVTQGINQREIDREYYLDSLYVYYDLYFMLKDECWLQGAEEIAEEMHKDGFSYAEIGRTSQEARSKALQLHTSKSPSLCEE